MFYMYIDGHTCTSVYTPFKHALSKPLNHTQFNYVHVPGMSMSFSIALCHIAMTHKLLFQCNLRDEVEGIFLPSVSALNQTFRRMMSSHFMWYSESSLAVMEWYRVIGEENSKADACALKYVHPTSLKKAFSHVPLVLSFASGLLLY